MNKTSSAQVTWSLTLAARKPDETLQNWLYRTLRQDILDGRLARNFVLPSTRFLAAQYGLARGTVQAAYAQLLSEGYLVTAHGSGTKVSLSLPDDQLVKAGPVAPDTATPPAASPIPLTRWAAQLIEQDPAFPLSSSKKLPFAPHTCDVAQFPVDTWRRLHMRHLGSVLPPVLSARPAQGLPALRQAIVEHLAIARGVATSADTVVIVSSVQQALDICLRLIINPGESVWMENPGYPGARQIMQGVGADIIDVAVDAAGMDVSAGMRLAPDARLAYVTPCRQAPTGVALSAERRLMLLSWAREHGAYLFEDDYDSEYRFIAKPIPALRGMPQAGSHVIMTGTFSKLLFPAMGLAYVVLPPQLVEPFTRALSLTSRSANGLAQAVLADFMAQGHFGRHIRRMRKVYATRARVFEDAARQHLHDFIEVPPILAGLDVTARLKSMPEAQALAVLDAANVSAFALSRYGRGPHVPPGLVMGFAAYTEDQITQQMSAIAQRLNH
ncbi:PLP-dependent aminotransferase family protein [Pseudomonas sp. PDM04]|uniref:MocR-like pyridoxine biosynthesis transcription factor PdxR n=1 Tax=Pseudomonas sp. PDM04 TaxID=2769296 RepID=UPI00177ABC26|nr:PLP-dependent aminotransferase family protein [Pseudomonas sp. PDM04]MBD9442761.1 PLP-dependent aminotransferase family protein [Pseudomonas sp. PDM04]